MISIPVLYGNVEGGYTLTDKKWNERVGDQVSLVLAANVWLFFAVEMHEEKGAGLPDGGHRYFLGLLRAKDLDWALIEGDGGNHCYYRPSKVTGLGARPRTYATSPRSYTDFTILENTTSFVFHPFLTHLRADDNDTKDKNGKVVKNGKSRDAERKSSAREFAKAVGKAGWAFAVGDFNSSSERDGYPRDTMENAGFFGLRQRGSVVNGTQSTRSTSAKKSYWIDEIFTRKAQTVTGSELVVTNGASDHNGWLKTTIGFDVDAPAGSPTGPTTPPVKVRFVPPASPTDNPWSATLRGRDYDALDDLRYTSATLVENFNQPDMLSIVGKVDQLAVGVSPGAGILLHDDLGTQRFSGHLVDLDRTGDGTVALIYASDLVRLWWRICWPNPAGDWTKAGQNRAYDVLTGPAETRLLSLVDRNTGASARDERAEALLRLPATQGRGPSATTSARFDVLGVLAGTLAESANLRVVVEQVYTGSTPNLRLSLVATPDLSDDVVFSPPEQGGTYLLDPLWRYRLAIPTVNVALSAAGGQGADRILTAKEDQDSQDMWQARIEQLVDQRDTTDASEIAAGLTDAIAAGAGPTEIALPIGRAPGLGREIPVGARVAAAYDDQVFYDRVRQVTTTLGKQTGSAGVQVTGTIGSPDGIQSPTQRRLARALQAAKKGQRI